MKENKDNRILRRTGEESILVSSMDLREDTSLLGKGREEKSKLLWIQLKAISKNCIKVTKYQVVKLHWKHLLQYLIQQHLFSSNITMALKANRSFWLLCSSVLAETKVWGLLLKSQTSSYVRHIERDYGEVSERNSS